MCAQPAGPNRMLDCVAVRAQVYLAYTYIAYKDIDAEPITAVCLYLVHSAMHTHAHTSARANAQ